MSAANTADAVDLIECESCHRMVPLEECCTEEVVECDDCGHARVWSEGRSAAASYAHEVNAERLRGIADDARQAAKDGAL